jgi:hypothetical protein
MHLIPFQNRFSNKSRRARLLDRALHGAGADAEPRAAV